MVLGRGQASLAAAAAAGGRPPSPATADQPRQTRVTREKGLSQDVRLLAGS